MSKLICKEIVPTSSHFLISMLQISIQITFCRVCVCVCTLQLLILQILQHAHARKYNYAAIEILNSAYVYVEICDYVVQRLRRCFELASQYSFHWDRIQHPS